MTDKRAYGQDAQRVNITIPSSLRAEIKEYCNKHGMSFSAFLAYAGKQLMREERERQCK